MFQFLRVLNATYYSRNNGTRYKFAHVRLRTGWCARVFCCCCYTVTRLMPHVNAPANNLSPNSWRFFYLCSPFVARFKRCSKRPQFDWNAATERNNNEPFYSWYKKRKKGTSCKWSRISSSAPVKPIWGLQHKLCLCCAGSLCIADEGLFSRLHDGRTIDVTYAALLLEHSVRVVGNEAKIFGKTAFVLVRMRLSTDIMFDTALFYVYIAQWNHWFTCFPYFLSVQTLTLCAIHFETMIL